MMLSDNISLSAIGQYMIRKIMHRNELDGNSFAWKVM